MADLDFAKARKIEPAEMEKIRVKIASRAG